jgi:hypothetical protein
VYVIFNKGWKFMAKCKNKHENFIRLAEKRTSKAIKAIRLIGNLSNKSNYQYSDIEIQKMFRAVEKELGLSKSKFLPKADKNKELFKF